MATSEGGRDHPDVATYVSDLSRRCTEALRGAVDGARRVVLLDAASYANVGDCAITLGTLAVLAAAGVDVEHVSSHRGYDPRAVRRSLPADGVVLLQGGGNFGDVWPRNQAFREQVWQDFPDHRVVQLPQSIHYEEPARADRARRLIERHGSVTVLARDRDAQRLAAELLGVSAPLVPDFAFGLGPLPTPDDAPDVEVLWLLRSDKESVTPATEVVGPDAAVEDWPRDRAGGHPPALRAWWALDRVARAAGGMPGARRVVRAATLPLARARVRGGTTLLGRGRRVVTDRLHGHILATLCGIPHVAVDNANGKIRSFMDTWPGLAEDFATFVPSLEGAEEAVGRLRQGW